MCLQVLQLAYIDPGSGSFLLQMLLAGMLAGMTSLRIFWGRIRVFLRLRDSRSQEAREPRGQD